jgi:hypothetical protein
MPGAPQSGFAILVSRMSSRVSCVAAPAGHRAVVISSANRHSETGAAPADHRLRLEDFQRIEHFKCPYRKSNPDVLMMQSSQERLGNDAADGLDCPRNWRILVQR